MRRALRRKHLRISVCFLMLLALLRGGQTQAAPKEKENLATWIPPNAQKLINDLPERQITLDLVLKAGVASSDSFKSVIAQAATVELPALQQRTGLETNLSLSASRTLDQSDTLSQFAANPFMQNLAAINLSTAIPTGTALSVDLSHGITELGFFSGPLTGLETRAKVNLSQQLLRNAFGTASRAGLASGEAGREAAALTLKEATENWALNLIQFYYQAWFLKVRTQAADDGVGRRQRLENITKIRLNRGTSETTDLLQVQSALIKSRAIHAEANQQLNEIWRQLITNLRLPQEWMFVNPILVPMGLDNPIPEAVNACGLETVANPGPTKTTASEKARLQAEAARAGFDKAASMALPDLTLNLTWGSNSIDPDFATTWNEMTSARYPSFTVGLKLVIPLSGYLDEINYRSALAERDRTDAVAAQAKSDLQVLWLNTCADLRRWMLTTEDYRSAYEKQTRRAQLEEQRFQIGRTTTLAVIQAGDEATQSTLDLRQAEYMTRMTAWKVRNMRGELSDYLKDLLAKAQKDKRP